MWWKCIPTDNRTEGKAKDEGEKEWELEWELIALEEGHLSIIEGGSFFLIHFYPVV